VKDRDSPSTVMPSAKKRPGLYANIHAKQERIAHGSGEKMRKPGSAGAPAADAFDAAAKTADARKTRAKKTAVRTRPPAKKAATRKPSTRRTSAK